MRVLLMTDSPDPSGLGEHMLTLAAALAGRGVDAALAVPDSTAGRALASRAAGLSVVTVAADGWASAIAASGADLVHVHAGIGWEGHGLTRAAAAAGARVVRTEHLPWLLTDPAQIAEYAAALHAVDGLIAVSHAAAKGWRRALRAIGAEAVPLAAIPNGIAIHPALPRDARQDRDPVILCVGRFTAQKRHRRLLGALARLRRDGSPAKLWLAGSGPLEPLLRRSAARLGIAGAVVFLGQRDDVPALMARADVLALPSAFEGLPLVVLEAMAAGLPVVASAIGGTIEALGPDHPWLVASGRSRDFASALSDALSHPLRRQAVATRQTRRQAEQFGADRMALDTANFYRAAMLRRKGGRMDHVRLGFIGAGGIAQRHLGVLATMTDVTVAAVADPDSARAGAVAARTGAVAYSSHAAMLEAETLDAIFICVPPFAHGEVERACLAKGLPFLVEKPLSLDLEMAEEIAAAVERAGLITAVGYHWRYLDTVDEARAHLADNPAHLMQGFWIDQTPPPDWWWREDRGGGQIVEQATHLIDAARFLAGDVTEVFGMASRRDRPDFATLTVPTATAATLRFASGAIASLSATCLLRWNHRVGLHVFSDAMAIEISDHDLMVDVGQGRPTRPASGDPVWRQDRDFIEAVMGRENRIRCPYGEALETHRVALAISRSARDGALVGLEALRDDPQPTFRASAAQGPDHAA